MRGVRAHVRTLRLAPARLGGRPEADRSDCSRTQRSFLESDGRCRGTAVRHVTMRGLDSES